MRSFLRSTFLATCLIAVAAAPAPAPTSTADDTDFLFRLGMLEGHLMVGHDLSDAKKYGLSLPHFGHPVRELYDDISDYIDKRHLAPFDTQLIKLEAAMAAAPGTPATEAMYQQTIAAVHAARDTVPKTLRDSVPAMIKVCADTIDAASGEYGESLDRGQVVVLVEYHDSRGFISYVQQELDDLKRNHPASLDQDTLAKFQSVLTRAQWIVDPLIPSPQPRASVGQYRTIAGQAEEVSKSYTATVAAR